MCRFTNHPTAAEQDANASGRRTVLLRREELDWDEHAAREERAIDEIIKIEERIVQEIIDVEV